MFAPSGGREVREGTIAHEILGPVDQSKYRKEMTWLQTTHSKDLGRITVTKTTISNYRPEGASGGILVIRTTTTVSSRKKEKACTSGRTLEHDHREKEKLASKEETKIVQLAGDGS